MSRIVIIVGHARKVKFCEALGEAYRRGAEAGGMGANAAPLIASPMPVLNRVELPTYYSRLGSERKPSFHPPNSRHVPAFSREP